MGVKSCSRYGCNNIMCSMYSYNYGYLCGDCFNELLHSNLTIEAFMKTSPREGELNRIEEIYNEFEDTDKDNTDDWYDSSIIKY